MPKVVIGIGGGTLEAGGGAVEKTIAHYIRLVYLQSLLHRWLSGSVLGLTTGIGEGIVEERVGATKGKSNKLGEFVHVSECEREELAYHGLSNAQLNICKH